MTLFEVTISISIFGISNWKFGYLHFNNSKKSSYHIFFAEQ